MGKGSEGEINPYLTTAVNNARQVFHNVDVYIFPDTGNSASSEITSYMNTMLSAGILTTNMVWMDIENTPIGLLPVAPTLIGSKKLSTPLTPCTRVAASPLVSVSTLARANGHLSCATVNNSPTTNSGILTMITALLSLISAPSEVGPSPTSSSTPVPLTFVVPPLTRIIINSMLALEYWTSFHLPWLPVASRIS